MMNVKIGIVGCGKISERHLNAYRKMGTVEVVVSDVNKTMAKNVAEKYKVEWVERPEEIIEDDTIDAIDICVPTVHHKELIDAAVEHNKHFFCEKPLTSSLKEAREIKAKVEKAGIIAMVGYLYRFHPSFELVKNVLEDMIIGDPYFAIFRLGGRGSHKIWKHRKSQGGGAINEMFVHMLDLVLWYFGDVESVNLASVDIILREREVEGEIITVDAEDKVLVELQTAKCRKVVCESDLLTPSYMNYIEIQGTNGSVWASILDYFPTIVYCKEAAGIYNQGNNFFNFPRVDLFERELRYFIETLQKGETPDLNSIEDSVKMLEVIEEIRRRCKW
jgi:predicted dehydrogenase